CQAACTNFGGLITCRLVIGLAEAGLLPGILFYLGFWYRNFEYATRVGIVHSSFSIAGAFSGLLAAGIANLHGTLSAWRWISIL
ncbi:hypothetical protein M427DRAFT_77463, partial [Gonapodya prolifera JEL478]